MAAVAAVGGNVLVQNVIPKHMECITSKLQEMGAKVINYDDSIRIMRTGKLRQTTVKTRALSRLPHGYAGAGLRVYGAGGRNQPPDGKRL